MNNLNIHPLIKTPLILFATVMMFSIVVIAVSGVYLDQTYESRESEKRTMGIWKNKISVAKESNEMIDKYERRYKGLLETNIIGEENRLNWLETIQAAANSRGISSVKYNIASQHLVEDRKGMHRANGLKVYRSDMTIDMAMAHEGDLFAMFGALEDKAKGLFTVNKCIIEQAIKSSKINAENMQAYCELSWYTFRLAKNDGGK